MLAPALWALQAAQVIRLGRTRRATFLLVPIGVPLAPWARICTWMPCTLSCSIWLHQVHQGATRRWLAAFCLRADLLVVVRVVSESVSEYRLQPSPAVRVRPCFDARAGAVYVWL